MTEFLFHYVEPAVSWDNALVTFVISLVISFGVGAIVGSVSRSVVLQAISSLIFQVIVIILFFALRDEVQDYRLAFIKNAMYGVLHSTGQCTDPNMRISSWRDGITAIANCPKEVGYYVATADLLAADKDYESAATLIENGVDLIGQYPIPDPLCHRLQLYYPHLSNRPPLDGNCRKFHDL